MLKIFFFINYIKKYGSVSHAELPNVSLNHELLSSANRCSEKEEGVFNNNSMRRFHIWQQQSCICVLEVRFCPLFSRYFYYMFELSRQCSIFVFHFAIFFNKWYFHLLHIFHYSTFSYAAHFPLRHIFHYGTFSSAAHFPLIQIVFYSIFSFTYLKHWSNQNCQATEYSYQ